MFITGGQPHGYPGWIIGLQEPAVPVQPRLFRAVAVAVTVALAGALATPYLPAAGLVHTTGVRLIGVVVGALLLAAACTAARCAPARQDGSRD